MVSFDKLDNPVWYSLTERHQAFSVHYDTAKFYHPDYCPFGGFAAYDNLANGLAKYALLTDNFFVVGEKPILPTALAIKQELVCLQMIRTEKIEIEIKETITLLNNEYEGALFKLVNQVQPGYFKRKTVGLGNYYGIFKNNKLVAGSGERMCMDGFVEVSAVVTHPANVGKGYAKQLIAHTVNAIIEKNSVPFLHVVETNVGAIALYHQLGFSTRRKMSFWNIVKN
jgi:ribosomal protein S18 acetylase RimI-like enzyme